MVHLGRAPVSVQVCSVLWWGSSHPSPVLSLLWKCPKHITDTNKPVMCQPRCCIDVWLMRVGIWSCLSFVLECRTTLGLQEALHLTVMISCEGMAGVLMGRLFFLVGFQTLGPEELIPP